MTEVDLSALRRDPAPPPRRLLGPRIAVAGLAVVALGVSASFLIPLLRPVRVVRTAPVVRAASGDNGPRVATAEAAGWIEPDPFPSVVRPLVAGVLIELPVLEGDRVTAGETVVGRMRSAELLAARDRATAELARAEADVAHRKAELEVAEALLAQKADVRLADATARHDVESLRARLERRRGEHDEAVALLAARRADLEGQERLATAGGSYPVALAKARAAADAARAAVAARAKGVETAIADLARGEATQRIAREVVDDPRALQGAADTARAHLAHIGAQRDAARVELEVAERELAWSTITSPVDGVVLRLLAAPGARVGPEGEGVVSLYDPKRLQARVDVPLAAVAGVAIDQEVAIRSEVLGQKTVRGTVIRIQRESDLLKNTLQVKVRLIDPDPILRPETLVRARFLASAGDADRAAAGPAIFAVSRAAVRGGAVFVLDTAAGRARRVAVETVGEQGDRVLVRGALSPAQRVILDDRVADGDRVRKEER